MLLYIPGNYLVWISMAPSARKSRQIPLLPRPAHLAAHPELGRPWKEFTARLSHGPLSQDDLEALGKDADQITRTLLDSFTDLEPVLDGIAHLNDRVTRTILDEAVQTLDASGMGPPPRPFCWISMGSEARMEQVIRTDQDNALIYADDSPTDPNKNPDPWFAALAREVTRDLAAFGFSLCKGEVMAVNPLWRKSLDQWKRSLDQWVGSAEPEDVRKLTILLDFRGVYGDGTLADALHARVFELFKNNLSVNHYLVRDDNLFAAPRTFFGRIRTRRQPNGKRCFNIKTSGLAHLINGIRILAVNQEIATPSTLGRLTALEAQGTITPQEHQRYKDAFLFLTRLKIRNHLTPTPEIPVNRIILSQLPPDKRQQLESALDTVIALQKRIRRSHNVAWMNFFN
ncbi:MAG: DUF294 nucleotidyltransferase-like domain-containing protein [Desulfobacterales bacterium]|nr:DUF294 nucleotidyltransferase-like domain-containing protein [Desulfobacterales bacterium]